MAACSWSAAIRATTGLGVNDVNLFDPTTNAWTTAARMTERRWYPTATTLSDGRVFVMAGYDDCYGPSCLVGRPEIFNPVANTWTPMPTADYVTPSYPFLFETPDGKIISAGSYKGTIDTRVLDLAAGTWSVLDSNPIDAGSAVMYAPGKIMKAGKWANSDPPFVAAHANTYVLDLNQPSPQWRASTPMNFARAYNMLTLLPDGTTLATAGSRTTDPGTGGQGVLEAEIWSPDSRDLDHDGAHAVLAPLPRHLDAVARWPRARGRQRPLWQPRTVQRRDFLAALSLQGRAAGHHGGASNRAARRHVCRRYACRRHRRRHHGAHRRDDALVQ